jgi:hypothetical protein
MANLTSLTKANRVQLMIWTFCCTVTVFIFLTYLAQNIKAGNGDIVMPLDDVYIHFQYAKQLARGEPYIYNPGGDPTSGATSFLYPYILAAGYVIGFKGLTLGLWAMGVGAFALLASMWFVYLLSKICGTPYWLSFFIALMFALTGSISWHFMSGMETGLVITFTLATIYIFIARQFWGFILSASLLAMIRPEGSVLALIAVGFAFLRRRFPRTARMQETASSQKMDYLWLAIPVLAALVQPVVNWILTGSASATGNQAKSILSIVPFDWDVIIDRIRDNFTRIWGELATGRNSYFAPFVLGPLAGIGLATMISNREKRFTGFLIFVWFLAMTAAISTLDTAFWHFKRYQMPLIALLFPLAAWGLGRIIISMQSINLPMRIHYAVTGLMIVVLILPVMSSASDFLRLYRVNVENVTIQPLAMARWLEENTSEDSIVAVHDVGMMRYLGGRTTIDMVGLTTSGAANAWRNGPGAVAEFLTIQNPRPDYIAAYTTARGLNYLAETGFYGELLAGFPAPDNYEPEDNVALAAEFQGIYKPDWSHLESNRLGENISLSVNDTTSQNLNIVGEINVAELDSESYYGYSWSNSEQTVGFATEVYEFDYANCATLLSNQCTILDGGRRINGVESFSLSGLHLNEETILVTRVHAANNGTIDIYANDINIATRWIPTIPGHWLDIATLIPASLVNSEAMNIRVETNMGDGFYMPYRYWILQGDYVKNALPNIALEPLASYQNDKFTLYGSYRIDDDLVVNLAYQIDGTAEGDYKYFVHLYDDIAGEPIAQADGYPGGGFPPGNWLPGTISDTIVVDLSQVPAGTYQLAVGFYDPYTFERLTPIAVSDNVRIDEANRRLFIGEMEIPDHG